MLQVGRRWYGVVVVGRGKCEGAELKKGRRGFVLCAWR